jgi:hypothetical protein
MLLINYPFRLNWPWHPRAKDFDTGCHSILIYEVEVRGSRPKQAVLVRLIHGVQGHLAEKGN